MTNPLARVVMNTIIKMTNDKDTRPSYSGDGNYSKNEINLTHKEENIISRLIQGEKSVVEEKKYASPITLEEAANRIRKR